MCRVAVESEAVRQELGGNVNNHYVRATSRCGDTSTSVRREGARGQSGVADEDHVPCLKAGPAVAVRSLLYLHLLPSIHLPLLSAVLDRSCAYITPLFEFSVLAPTSPTRNKSRQLQPWPLLRCVLPFRVSPHPEYALRMLRPLFANCDFPMYREKGMP